jgi:hypothetical protein
MPEISRFMGMVICIFFNDHEIPHIHVYYEGKLTKIDFDGNVISRLLLPLNKLHIIRDWIKKYQYELRSNWDKIRERKMPERIEAWKK